MRTLLLPERARARVEIVDMHNHLVALAQPGSKSYSRYKVDGSAQWHLCYRRQSAPGEAVDDVAYRSCDYFYMMSVGNHGP